MAVMDSERDGVNRHGEICRTLQDRASVDATCRAPTRSGDFLTGAASISVASDEAVFLI